MRKTWNIRRGVVPWDLRPHTDVVVVEPGQLWQCMDTPRKDLVYEIRTKHDGKVEAWGSDGKMHKIGTEALRRRFRLVQQRELRHG